MAIASVIAGVKTVTGVASIASSLFGPSPEFQARQAASDEFFALRNEIFGLEPYMSPDLLAEWKSLSLHRADYNTRRENDAERAELNRFAQKLNAYLATAPVDSRVLSYGTTTKPVVGVQGVTRAGGGLLSGGPVLLAGAGVLAWLLFK